MSAPRDSIGHLKWVFKIADQSMYAFPISIVGMAVFPDTEDLKPNEMEDIVTSKERDSEDDV